MSVVCGVFTFAGDLAGLMAQVERLSSRMLAMSNTLQGVSSSNRRVEEQLVNVADVSGLA